MLSIFVISTIYNAKDFDWVNNKMAKSNFYFGYASQMLILTMITIRSLFIFFSSFFSLWDRKKAFGKASGNREPFQQEYVDAEKKYIEFQD